MAEWAGFLRLFSFRGSATSTSRPGHRRQEQAMTSPCGRSASRSTRARQRQAGQIQEYLDRYRGEGIQHIAMGSGQPLRHGGRPANAGGVAAEHQRDLLRAAAQRIPGLKASRHRRCNAQHPGGRCKRMRCCCRSSARTSSAPSSSSSSSAKGDEGFGNGNFRWPLCSSPSSWTRSGAAYSRLR